MPVNQIMNAQSKFERLAGSWFCTADFRLNLAAWVLNYSDLKRFVPAFAVRISAKMNGDFGIVDMDSGAVNSDSGQYERSGSEGLVLRSIILGRGGFSAE